MTHVKSLWQDRYRLGIDIIDDQHKSFFATVNAIHEEAADGASNVGEVVRAVVAMRAYAFKHFHTEEMLMAKVGFPGLYAHTRLHDVYLRDLMVFTEELEVYAHEPDMDAGEAFLDLALRIADYSAKWWAEHILKVDAVYADHIRAMKGPKA